MIPSITSIRGDPCRVSVKIRFIVKGTVYSTGFSPVNDRGMCSSGQALDVTFCSSTHGVQSG